MSHVDMHTDELQVARSDDDIDNEQEGRRAGRLGRMPPTMTARDNQDSVGRALYSITVSVNALNK